MSCNILYLISNGQLLEANFGPVSAANGAKSVIQADFLPDFDEYYVLSGVLTRRTQVKIDAIKLARQQTKEARQARKANDKTVWTAGIFYNKTPAEVQQIIATKLDITSVAQLRAALLEILPVMAAGIAALAYRELED